MAFLLGKGGAVMHETYMNEALKEAKKAYELDEVPVGAVIVYQNRIIARSHNLRENKQNPLAHAEMLAINEASEVLGTWKLNECILYVTLEPCIMCAGSIIQSRIGTVVFGAKDPKGGSMGSHIDLMDIKGFNHYPQIVEGILKEETSNLLKQYFKEKRDNKCVISVIKNQEEFKLAKAIRETVFVHEQNVDPDIEYDEYDSINRDDVIHLIAKIKNEAAGTMRLIKNDKTIKVGRVAVRKEWRGHGIGLKMMHYAEKYACNNGFDILELGAQLTAIPFYEKSGYKSYGEIFLDADIEHKMMKKRCRD